MAGQRSPGGILAASAIVVAGMGVASLCAPAVDVDVRARLALVVERANARAAARDGNREATWGETTSGSAYDFYALAGCGLAAISKGTWDEETAQWSEDNRPVTAERFAELRAQWAPRLVHLTQGSHCRDAHSKRQGVDSRLCWLVAAEVSSRLDEGRTTAAVQLWLDGVRFRCDVRQGSGDMFPWWTDGRLRSLPDADLDLLGEGLARLDGRLAQTLDPESFLAIFIAQKLDHRPGNYPVRYWLAAWRQGFDVQRRELEAFDELVQIAAVLKPPAADGPARQEQWRAYERAPRHRATPGSDHIDGMLTSCGKGNRAELTKLRLLRLAVAFHRRAPLPSLADPFAPGALEVRFDGDTAVFRGAESFPGRERFATRR